MSNCRWLIAGALILFPIRASADEWFPAKVETYYSQNHRTRFTVTPRDISRPLSYFEGKVRGKKLAGQRRGSPQTFARGVLEKEGSEGRWTVVWDHRLVNDVSPLSAVVSNSSNYVVTFDNWHSMGWGNVVIVIYGPGASTIRSLSLKNILLDDYIYALPHWVSSIWWSGKHYIAEPSDLLILKIVVASDEGLPGRKQYVDLPLLMSTGQIQRPAGTAWQQALTRAEIAAKAQRAAEKAMTSGSNRHCLPRRILWNPIGTLILPKPSSG